jgi:PAS domain S-box-containing protein
VEDKLWQMSEYQRALVDNSDLGITIVDKDHKIIKTNITFSKLFQKPAHTFVGKYCYKEYEKRENICSHCPGVLAMASGKTEEVETQGVLDDGTRIHARVQAIPFGGPDGKVAGFIEIVENIEDRKIAEKNLQNSEQKYKTLFRESLDAIILADAESGILLDCNPVAENLFGYSREELIGKHQKTLHPYETTEEQFSTTFKEHISQNHGKLLKTQIVTKDGQIKDVAIKANIIEVEDNIILQGIFRDVTDSKLEDAISEANHFLEEVVY